MTYFGLFGAPGVVCAARLEVPLLSFLCFRPGHEAAVLGKLVRKKVRHPRDTPAIREVAASRNSASTKNENDPSTGLSKQLQLVFADDPSTGLSKQLQLVFVVIRTQTQEGALPCRDPMP